MESSSWNTIHGVRDMTSVSAGLSVSGKCTAERFQYAEDRYPDSVMLANGSGCGAASIKKKSDL